MATSCLLIEKAFRAPEKQLQLQQALNCGGKADVIALQEKLCTLCSVKSRQLCSAWGVATDTHKQMRQDIP